MFAIFILKGNKWILHMDSPSKLALAYELDYLVSSLGVTAKIFKKL